MILQGTTPTLTISIDPDELSLADTETENPSGGITVTIG